MLPCARTCAIFLRELRIVSGEAVDSKGKSFVCNSGKRCGAILVYTTIPIGVLIAPTVVSEYSATPLGVETT